MLDELQDILDEIVPDATDTIIHDEEFVDAVLQLMEEYIEENIVDVMEEDFHETFIHEIFELVVSNFENDLQFYHYADCKQRVEDIVDVFYESFMPPRSYESTLILNPKVNVRHITSQLNILRNKPQPDQRTAEWYAFRHNLITASNAYKTLMNGAEYNQIVFEKCKPLYIPGENDKNDKNNNDGTPEIRVVNVETTLHWGQKYEPLSVLIYEHLYDTKIEDFGCIQHNTHPFLGASPDGINVESSSPLYGRMLEFKNIVNRDITGIPKLEYWVQMQLQMETCELEECDFLETRFKEYEDQASYLNDAMPESGYKGMIMYFSKNGAPTYKYAPLSTSASRPRLDKWEEKQRCDMEEQEYMWVKNIYWKIDEMSCVLVKRNHRWFEAVVPIMQKAWDTIVYEREHGFDHRKPAKRYTADNSSSKKGNDKKSGSGLNKCMLMLNKETGGVDVTNGLDTTNVQVVVSDDMKIRTESIDDTRKKME